MRLVFFIALAALALFRLNRLLRVYKLVGYCCLVSFGVLRSCDVLCAVSRVRVFGVRYWTVYGPDKVA